MAETSRARTGLFVQKLFELLIKNPEGIQAKEAIAYVEKSVSLTEYEKGEYDSGGGRRFEKILRFATVDCAKAGWLFKDKGTWSLTPEGIIAFGKFKDPEALYREAARLYGVWKRNQAGQDVEISDTVAGDGALTEEATLVTFEKAQEQASAEIERYLRNLNPYDFQQLVADLIIAMGYHVSWISPPGKDGGVDIIAHTDPLGTRPPRIKIQVKRVGDRISSDGLKSFIALINEDDVGLYVSTGRFTRDAEDFARSQERRKITLIDLGRFVDLWIEHSSRLSEAARKRFSLTPIYFFTPTE